MQFSQHHAASWVLATAPTRSGLEFAEAARKAVSNRVLLPVLAAVVLLFAILWRSPLDALIYGAIGLLTILGAGYASQAAVMRRVPFSAPAARGQSMGPITVIISVIAGGASYACLRVTGVPFPEVLALWVGFADLIPLVGATIGAAPAVLVAFLHSVPAGIAVLAFFIIYQQFENHVLQVTIMARTVQLNPLAVLVSVLVGVELFGFLGALLAIPAGGAIQIVVREIRRSSSGLLALEEPAPVTVPAADGDG